MEIKLYWTEAVKMPPIGFIKFAQRMANRIIVGHFQYGEPHKRKKYLSRLRMELKAYDKTGNTEHLINIANYAWLEIEAPEHKKAHDNPYAASVTRGKMRGSKAKDSSEAAACRAALRGGEGAGR